MKTVWYKSKVIAFLKLNYLLKSPYTNTLLIRRQKLGLLTTLFLVIFIRFLHQTTHMCSNGRPLHLFRYTLSFKVQSVLLQ